MNAKIFECSKCYSFTFQIRLFGTPLAAPNAAETVQLNPRPTEVLPNLDLRAIQPAELTGIQVNMGMIGADYISAPININRLGMTMRIDGERPTDTITTNTFVQSPFIYFNDFGTSEMMFTKSERWRNVKEINISELSAYSPYGIYQQIVSADIEAVVGVTINLYYI